MMNAIAAATLSESLADGFDMNHPEMLLLTGAVSLNAVYQTVNSRSVVVAEDEQPVSSAAPTVAPRKAA